MNNGKGNSEWELGKKTNKRDRKGAELGQIQERRRPEKTHGDQKEGERTKETREWLENKGKEGEKEAMETEKKWKSVLVVILCGAYQTVRE